MQAIDFVDRLLELDVNLFKFEDFVQLLVFLIGMVFVETFLVWMKIVGRKRAINDCVLAGSIYILIQLLRIFT